MRSSRLGLKLTLTYAPKVWEIPVYMNIIDANEMQPECKAMNNFWQ